MTRIISLLFVLTISFSSCRSAFDFSILQPKGEIHTKLPSLESVVYIETIENAYKKKSISSERSLLSNAIKLDSTQTINYSDRRVNDVLVVFDRDVKDNITDNDKKKKGCISLKISNLKYDYRSRFETYLGAEVVTSYLMSLLIYPTIYREMIKSHLPVIVFDGFFLSIPLTPALIYPLIIKPKAIQTIEIEVEILNLKGNVIGKYNGIGIGSYTSNMYNFPKDVQRIVNIEAFKNAMKEIKSKIDNDSDRIKTELE